MLIEHYARHLHAKRYELFATLGALHFDVVSLQQMEIRVLI